MFSHLDTNGIALHPSEKNFRLIDEAVDLIGLPLDGPSAAVHNTMRAAQDHFDTLMTRLTWLEPFRSKMKLNTVVTQMNARHIVAMVDIVRKIGPCRWSLYQYWPLSAGLAAKAEHEISQEEFLFATAALPQRVDETVVEVNATTERRSTYPFVSHDGILYVHSQQSISSYEKLGSIFDDQILPVLFSKTSSERPQARPRYLKVLR